MNFFAIVVSERPLVDRSRGNRMARNSNDLNSRLQAVIKAWSTLRPDKLFAGFTLDEFRKAVAPSIELREAIASSNAHTRKLMVSRDEADVLTRKVLQRVVSGVRADGDEGEDGELYTAMGYVARTVRSALQGMGRTKRSEEKPAVEPGERTALLTDPRS